MRTRRYIAVPWLALFLVLANWSLWAQAQPLSKPKPTSDFSDLADGILAELGAAWWNPEWPLRRRLLLSGPGLATLADRVAFFQNPDPLLLFNTGRCQDQFADLRIVTGDGTVLPAGVLNFGRDDGSCWLWCLLPEGKTGDLFVYYGNRQAKPREVAPPARLEPPPEPTLVARLGPEEAAEGKPLPKPPPPDWLSRIVAVEAESFGADSGTPGKPLTQIKTAPGASCEQLITLAAASGASQSGLVWSKVLLDSAGTWHVHVRRWLPPKSKPQPFQLLLGEQEFKCGLQAESAGGFRWEHFALELAAGPHKVGLRLLGDAAVDCLIFTRDASYVPDYRDVTGPVWMRFKLLTERKESFFADWYCVHTPYSERGMLGRTACVLFGDEVARTHADAKPLAADPGKLIAPGQWSAWGRSLHSGNYTWFSQIQFIAGGPSAMPLRGARIAWQAATRDDDARVFREGVEQLGNSGTLKVRMPTGLDYTSLGMLESFGQWSKRRFEMAESLGFKSDEGPRSLVMATMADSFDTPTELENFLKTCNWLGLNTVSTHYPDQQLFAQLAARYRIPWALSHPFYTGIGLDSLSVPKPGNTYLDSALVAVGRQADEYYRIAAAQDQSWAGTHQRYGLLGDEIGPAISSVEINSQSFAKGLFVEFLERQRLTPEFFGAESWDDVQAIDFVVESNIRLERALERQRLVARTERDVQRLLGKDFQIDEVRAADKPDAEEILDEEKKRAQPAVTAKPLAARFVKRSCHWTQKFRSQYTCDVYRLATAAAKKYSPAGFQCSVNLQAMPAQAGQMWDGGLNIFDLGRRQAFDSLYTEDWDWNTYHVAFSMGLLRAAARKHQQDTGSYVVGGMPQGRIVANLAQGARTMVFYLYGPVHSIGPVWGEHQESMKELGDAMRLAAHCEEDLLAAANRPADVALLVANTSEINDRFLSSGFGAERLAIITALADAQMPVDIVGEEEIIEDDILSRYRALYVCDPHVDSRAQQQIKRWVAAGGVLWATGFALARQEYDEPSTALDEVFGLKNRGPIESPSPVGTPPAHIRVSPSDLLAELDFAGSPLKPQYELSTGKALAQFDEGGPAIVYNHFGQGQALLNGFSATCLAAHVDQMLPLATAGARAAGARQHLHRVAGGNCPQLYACVHDGPQQTVVFLFNDSNDRSQRFKLEIALPRPARSATSGRSGAITFAGRAEAATVSLDLPPRGAEILVFKP